MKKVFYREVKSLLEGKGQRMSAEKKAEEFKPGDRVKVKPRKEWGTGDALMAALAAKEETP